VNWTINDAKSPAVKGQLVTVISRTATASFCIGPTTQSTSLCFHTNVRSTMKSRQCKIFSTACMLCGKRNCIVKIAKLTTSVFGVTMTSPWPPSWILDNEVDSRNYHRKAIRITCATRKSSWWCHYHATVAPRPTLLGAFEFEYPNFPQVPLFHHGSISHRLVSAHGRRPAWAHCKQTNKKQSPKYARP
jgi:hypothetical protein